MRKYTVYVDQSGKIEDYSMNTGLAFSDEGGNNFTNAVFIDKEHKRRLKHKAKNDLGDIKKYQYKLFACGVFMLIQNDVHRISEVKIDKEYEGKIGLIKNYIYNFLINNSNVSKSSFPEISSCLVHGVNEKPECHDLSYKARERNLEHFLESDFQFLKAMILKSNR